jgi:hypothetical protein
MVGAAHHRHRHAGRLGRRGFGRTAEGAAALRDGLARQPPAFWEPVIEVEWRTGEPRRLERLVWALPKVDADAARQRRWRERFEAHPDAGVRRFAAWAWAPAAR